MLYNSYSFHHYDERRENNIIVYISLTTFKNNSCIQALFRGVAMMVPDFQMIMKVKLCSVGYEQFEMLSQKFFVLYNTSKEQLSAQKHYDWGTYMHTYLHWSHF